MNSCIIDGMDCMNARKRSGHHRLRDIVNKLAKERVFLRRAANDRERENRVLFAKHFLDSHTRKIVFAGVVADVVAKRTFGL